MPALPPITTTVCPRSSGSRRTGTAVVAVLIIPPETRDRESRRRERCRSRRSRSLRQLFAGLLRHHVGGVPVWPIRVALPRALLVLAVGGLRTPKCARQIVRRSHFKGTSNCQC